MTDYEAGTWTAGHVSSPTTGEAWEGLVQSAPAQSCSNPIDK